MTLKRKIKWGLKIFGRHQKRLGVVLSVLMIYAVFQNCGATQQSTTGASQTTATPTPVPTGIALSPASATVAQGGSLSFSASGGSGAYSYSLVSGKGYINYSSGAYTAPYTVETDLIKVTDSLGNIATASISVTLAPATPTPTVTSSTDFTITSATVSDGLFGWPIAHLYDLDPTTNWSSVGHTTSTNTEWLAYWWSGIKATNYIKLMPRYKGNTPLGYPVRYTIFYSNGTTWVPVLTAPATSFPTSQSWITINLPGTFNANGIEVVADTLGADDFGTYYFQMAEVAAGYDSTLTSSFTPPSAAAFGKAYSIKPVSANLCMGVVGASTAMGASIVQWGCIPSHPDQSWYVVPSGAASGAYKIVDAGTGGNLTISSSSSGASIIQGDSSGGNEQLWRFVPYAGGYEIKNYSTGQCLGVSGGSTSQGANLIQYWCDGSSNQAWNFY